MQSYTIAATGNRYELSAGPELPVLRMMLLGERAALTLDEKDAQGVPYHMEETRGYQWKGSLWSPGYFRADAAAAAGLADRLGRAVGHRRALAGGGGGPK